MKIGDFLGGGSIKFHPKLVVYYPKSLASKKQELKTIKTLYVIIGTLVTNIVHMPFITKGTQSKYLFDI